MRGLSPVAASGGHSSSRCAGLSLSRPLLLRSPGSRRAGSVVVAHGPSCSVACGIFPDQGSNPCPLHWQADSQPLRHQGSPQRLIFYLSDFMFKKCTEIHSVTVERILFYLALLESCKPNRCHFSSVIKLSPQMNRAEYGLSHGSSVHTAQGDCITRHQT